MVKIGRRGPIKLTALKFNRAVKQTGLLFARAVNSLALIIFFEINLIRPEKNYCICSNIKSSNT